MSDESDPKADDGIMRFGEEAGLPEAELPMPQAAATEPEPPAVEAPKRQEIVLEVHFVHPVELRNNRKVRVLKSTECDIHDHGETLEFHVPFKNPDTASVRPLHDVVIVPRTNVSSVQMRGVDLMDLARRASEQHAMARAAAKERAEKQELRAKLMGGGNGAS